MDFTLVITPKNTVKSSCVVRGNRIFIKKILRHFFDFSPNEVQLIISGNLLEKSEHFFSGHENCNSFIQDIEYLKSIQKVIADVEKYQTEEYVTILRDSILQIGKTIKNIDKNFSD